jgi:outer membrane protein OmpA-like peptidoglycan-associated protein
VNTMRFGLYVAALSLIAVSGRVQAQGIPLDRFNLGVRPDDAFYTSRLDRFGHGRVGIAIAADNAWNPLIIDAPSGEDINVVETQLVLHANVSVSLADRFILFAGMRGSAVMDGDPVPEIYEDQVTAAEGAGLGDTPIGARVRLLGADEDKFALGAQLTIVLPTAEWADDGQNYQGEGSTALTPAVLAELRFGIVRISGNVGVHVREDVQRFGVTYGDELRLALALGVRVIPPIELLADIYSGLGLSDFGARETSTLEWLAGAKFYLPGGFNAGLAGGSAMRPAVGLPDARVLVMLGWLSEGKVKKSEPPPPVVPLDSDSDGITDDKDACRSEPEDRDQFQDEDGCPDPDNDGDGVLDPTDQCATELEDRDQFQDEDGCPDPDNDGDGLLDAQDQCANEPEDKDGFVDDDGCPDPDNDKDRVLDTGDDCPMDPGAIDNRGCPKSIRVEEGSIRLLQQINFANNSDVILPDSTPILIEIRDALVTHARIRRIRVEGHTDDRGADKRNLDLSKRRAASVSRWLIEQGTSSDRLESWGCGEIQPIDSNKTTEGRAKNRRVAFQIVDPVPSTGLVLAVAGCQLVTASGSPSPSAAPPTPR